MNIKEIEEFKLIGLALENKTTNENGQSSGDCGNLWYTFEYGGYKEQIPDKLTDEVFAVYFNYEGDHTKPFSYFIGCKVEKGAKAPSGMVSLSVPKGKYQKIIAKGKMPDCIGNAWKEIWSSDIHRNFKYDFEVYGEKSKDPNNSEIGIFLSIYTP